MSRIVGFTAMAATILLVLLWVVGTVSAVPASRKTPGRRFRSPAGCQPDDHCPEFVGMQHFMYLDYLLPPHSRVYFKEAAYPMISRIYSTSDTDGTHTALWQLRTVTIDPEPDGLMEPGFRVGKRDLSTKHILMPFLLDTGAPHIHVAPHAQRYFLAHGALEGTVHLSICNVKVPLPHADVRCIRNLAPNPSIHTDGDRKNVLGGSGAAVLIALQAVFDEAKAQGHFKGCSDNPHVVSSVNCIQYLEELAERFISTNPTLSGILSHIEPRDKGTAEAIQVTVSAMHRDRLAFMKRNVLRELNLLLQAPTTLQFDDHDFLDAHLRHPNPDRALTKNDTKTPPKAEEAPAPTPTPDISAGDHDDNDDKHDADEDHSASPTSGGDQAAPPPTEVPVEEDDGEF